MNIEPTNRYWWNWSITTTECHYSRQKTTSASASSMCRHMAPVDTKNTAIPWAIPQNGRRPVRHVAEPPCKISRRSVKLRLKNPLLYTKDWLHLSWWYFVCYFDLIMSKLTKPPTAHRSQFKLLSNNVPQWQNGHKMYYDHTQSGRDIELWYIDLWSQSICLHP